VQGYGNAGATAARLFHDAGASVVAVSDSRGGIINEEGLDPRAVLAHKRETGTVVGFPGALMTGSADVLTAECDILIPAALECQVTTANARDVKARLVLEVANGPLTAAADEILRYRDIVVLPDILANAGGVVVSYFEWVQNLEHQKWNLDKVERLLNQKMCDAVNETVDRFVELTDRHEQGMNRDRPGPTLRDAALVTAITRIASVVLQRDIWP
jgi:glutamate dehydrogenase (NAD(P)+)